ncbi:hypothetical protein LGH70_00475 [Hymenobacter sp. BT635]|uniref:Uncharacterized protein n=1 Tax=Hymenobacter nitidus TaxID=2880929 RepID=A0ABS8A6L3_9BACT|nr:hypothetical protein [Hymenobacter nitidus]MCB2376037.1 hypothetical protein [Hymenobacter nitidus]
MLELIAIALLQLASFTNAPEANDTRANTDKTVIVATPSEAEQGGGGWGGD